MEKDDKESPVVFPDSIERIEKAKDFWITKHRNVWDRGGAQEVMEVRVMLTKPIDADENWLHLRVAK